MKFEIGDLVMMEADKYEDEVYGYVVGYDEEGFMCVEWFDGEVSRELPNIGDGYSHLKKVQYGQTSRPHR